MLISVIYIIRKLQAELQKRPSPPRRSQIYSTILPEDPFEQDQGSVGTNNEPKNHEDPGSLTEDPVLDIFNQFLQRARQIKICHTSKCLIFQEG